MYRKFYTWSFYRETMRKIQSKKWVLTLPKEKKKATELIVLSCVKSKKYKTNCTESRLLSLPYPPRSNSRGCSGALSRCSSFFFSPAERNSAYPQVSLAASVRLMQSGLRSLQCRRGASTKYLVVFSAFVYVFVHRGQHMEGTGSRWASHFFSWNC